MYIKSLDEFFDYKPIFDENPQFLVDEIIDTAKGYLGEECRAEIQRAYDFALEAHKGQKRHSGEPYIVHPVCSTMFLMRINPGIPSIQACLLHDAIEDTNLTYTDILKNFGEEVADLCEGMVKVGKIKYKGEDRQIETLKKTFLAMGKDLRVIFIKLADRIHNIQTLVYHPKMEKRRKIAEETLKIYVPIAQRLGLSAFQIYLENGSFRLLYEKDYERIVGYINKTYGTGETYIEKGIEMITKILDDEGIKHFEIKGRLKSPYRVFKKIDKYGNADIFKVMDILAFRVITDSIPNCYNILGILHSHYTPIIKKIKDYISIPKSNGYSSLHTTILGMFELPVEIQIRTKDMDEVAEYGVASHFAYKEVGKSVMISETQSLWIKRLQDLVKKFQDEPDKGNFKKELQVEFLDKNTFVYTPTGEVKELPAGSTVLDFAFRIHSDVGLSFKSAIVNNQIVPIDFKLRTGDIVKINNYKNKFTASKLWMDYLHTPSAKAKLNKYIKQIERDSILKTATNFLNDKLKELNLPVLGTKDDKITKKYKGEEMDNMLIKILDKQISRTRLIKEIYDIDFTKPAREEVKIKLKPQAEVIIDEDKNFAYTLCPECKPQPGDKIIGKISKDGIKIHTLKCKGLTNISLDKILKAHWKDGEPQNYILELNIMLLDRPGMLLKLLSIFSFLNINIKSINVNKTDEMFDETNKEPATQVRLELEFNNPSKIQFVLKELKKSENYVKIISKRFY